MKSVIIALLASTALAAPAFAAPNTTQPNAQPQQQSQMQPQNTQKPSAKPQKQSQMQPQSTQKPSAKPQKQSQAQPQNTLKPSAKPQKQSQAQPQKAPQQNQKQASNQKAISPNSLGQSRIRQVQAALDKDGFKAGRADGIWGPQTRTALEHFQKSKGMTNNGQLTQNTMTELGVNVSAPQHNHG